MSEKPFVVMGAGLVGSLLSIYLAKRGHKVEIYERREDMRKAVISAGKSINLALSDRGWKGLQGVGIADEIKKIAIPMKGRMVHDKEGKTNFFPYGKDGQAIYSVSRAGLNCLLMDLAEKHGAKIHFNQRCKSISAPTKPSPRGEDSRNTTAIVEDVKTHKETEISAERIFGTDGAFSAVRLQMQLSMDRFEYSQHYLDYGYKELLIPAKDGDFAMDKNCLHIWARGTFMMIALPNIDKSFTCTLFFPFEGKDSFASLTDRDTVGKFFKETFPDAVPLMPTLLDDFTNNPVSSLVTIRCYPWSIEDKVLLLGDAAHGVVPFYGQGMNCGFEDCTILEQLMEKHLPATHPPAPSLSNKEGNESAWKKIFSELEQSRKPNSDAIADLAVANFIEMRDLVTHPDFILQKKIEAHFSSLHPDKWLPLYTMVTFTDLPYSHSLKQGKKQDAIMKQVLALPNVEQKWNSKEVEELMLKLVSHA
jgi:kynurenine 3-monooxygenase